MRKMQAADTALRMVAARACRALPNVLGGVLRQQVVGRHKAGAAEQADCLDASSYDIEDLIHDAREAHRMQARLDDIEQDGMDRDLAD